MRICFIVGSFPSLSETFILNQMTGMLDQGNAVAIFAGVRVDEAVVHEDVIRSGLLQHIRYHNDKPRNVLVRFIKFLGLFPSAAIRAPLPVLQSLNFFMFGREALSLNLFYKTLIFLEAREYDIVFCHFGQNGLVGLRMKEVGALKGKLVVAFHAADITAYPERAGKNVYQRLFVKGDLFLPVSQNARQKLLELGCPEHKIHVHRMGVDLAQFSTATHKRFGAAPLKLLSVARLVEKKGISHGLEAVSRLIKSGLDCEYTIVGDGPLRKDIEAQIRAFQLEKKVQLVGWQDSGSVRSFLKRADVFLAPSIRAENGDEEGIPVVLMEAMASRVPVVATATGGIRELVEDNTTGFLVEEKSPEAIAAKLEYLWKNPDVVDKVAVSARAAIEKQYDIQALNQCLIKHFWTVAYEKRRT